MRACPVCHTVYSAAEEVCPADGARLVAEDELSDTLAQTQAQTRVAMSGVGAAATPSPVLPARPKPPELDSIVGSCLAGRYEVVAKIGEGGMGAVYEARHKLIGKRVAIKVLLDKYVQKREIVARLEQEARLASSIGHDHIVDITDFGETDDGRTFVVMEYLEGDSLATLLQREGPLPPTRVIALARQVASALGAAHEKGIVHRDVKPDNIFIIRKNGRDFAKVVDFGISKAMRPPDEDSASPRLTHTGMVLGTPLYMSPEQARGEEVLDHRIDIFSLGVIVFECLTGEVPFRGTNYLNIISQVVSQEPRPPRELRPDQGISEALEAVVLKAMAKDRGQRYQTMAELDSDLARLDAGLPVAVACGVRSHGERRRGRTLLWMAGVAMVAAASAALALAVVDGIEKQPEPAAVPVPPRPRPEPRALPPPIGAPTVPQPTSVRVKVTSSPAKAEILVGTETQGFTPEVIELARSDTPVSVRFRLEGYADEIRQVVPNRPDLEISVVFPPPKPGGGARRLRPKPGPESPEPDPPHGGGETKPNPY